MDYAETESIVVSLEWAKKLKKAKYPQKSCLHFWANRNPEWADESYIVNTRGDFLIIKVDRAILKLDKGVYAAPTAEEILRKLPDMLDDCILECSRSPAPELLWVCSYQGNDDAPHSICRDRYDVLCQKSLADSAAVLWIYLKENNLLSSAKC